MGIAALSKETSFLAPKWFPELSKYYCLQTLFMAEESNLERKGSAPWTPGEMFAAGHCAASPFSCVTHPRVWEVEDTGQSDGYLPQASRLVRWLFFVGHE